MSVDVMPAKENVKAEAKISDDLSQKRVERIRQRAYELYEARGREDGHDVDDWLQAEAEIIERRIESKGA